MKCSLLVGLVVAVAASGHLVLPTHAESVILYSDQLDIEPSNLAVLCLASLPSTIGKRCRDRALDHYNRTLLTTKRQCCSRWLQLECLEKYAYNAIYCNHHQQEEVARYFRTIHQTLMAPDNGLCREFPPIELERPNLLGHETPRCKPQGIL